ncbi:hypothetical protein TNCV_554971 [Trichonephila clavipes]|nr:hypothetical protein TNCV_554971 [Trichonephila clavipes]
MEVTRVEQPAYIKIAVLRGRNAMECHRELEALEINAQPYRTVTWWIKQPIRCRRFATPEDIANAVGQQVTQFTHDAANAEADGIQCLPHR